MTQTSELSSMLYGFCAKSSYGRFGYLMWSNSLPQEGMPAWVLKACNGLWGTVKLLKAPTEQEEEAYADYIRESQQLYYDS